MLKPFLNTIVLSALLAGAATNANALTYSRQGFPTESVQLVRAWTSYSLAGATGAWSDLGAVIVKTASGQTIICPVSSAAATQIIAEKHSSSGVIQGNLTYIPASGSLEYSCNYSQ